MACYALVPAAGGGSRMGSACPKQYLPLAGQPLIRHALATLCAVPAIARVFVVLAPDDQQWPGCQYLAAKLRVLRRGGATRAKSVANGLRAMDGVSDDDWVLVHDAARACLSVAHVEQLIRDVGDDPVGGILAVPVADTLKRARADGRIAATAPPVASAASPSHCWPMPRRSCRARGSGRRRHRRCSAGACCFGLWRPRRP